MYDGFPRTEYTPVTLTRGGALRAANDWLGRVRHSAAYSASFAGRDEEEAVRIGNDVLAATVDLPLECSGTHEEEKAWKAWIELHAFATNTSLDQAEAALRKDFKRFCSLLDTLLARWQDQCVMGNGMPYDEHTALGYLLLNECAWSAHEAMDYQQALHKGSCPNCTTKDI